MRRLHLVRHGRPLVDRSRPAHTWGLDPAGLDAVEALRDRLPAGAPWYSSPEPKAHDTALLVAETPVTVVDGLREHVRDTTTWCDDFPDTVRQALAEPNQSALPGWEPVTALRDRLLPAVRRLLDVDPAPELVLCGHGTAWTVLVSELTGAPPDLDRWAALAMPDVLVVDL